MKRIAGMKRLLICVVILAANCVLTTNGEKLVFVVPTTQIRRSPTFPARPNVRAASPYLKFLNPSGPARPGPPPSNQLPHGVQGEFKRPQNEIEYSLPASYGKGISGYAPYARGYLSYDKKGIVPLIPFRFPRLPPGAVYGPTALPSGYYHRVISKDSYPADKSLPIKAQPVDRPIHLPFTGKLRSPAHGIGDHQAPSHKEVHQPAASHNYPKLGPIIVPDPPHPSNHQRDATRNEDSTKESSNSVKRVPSSSAIGSGNGAIVLGDTVFLGDYEQKIAEFTKRWPKLSAFPGAYADTSSFFPGSPYESSPLLSYDLSRTSDRGISSSIGRKGYAVTEEIDEPPYDFKKNPIIANPFYPPWWKPIPYKS